MKSSHVYYRMFDSSVGQIGLAFTQRGLCRVLISSPPQEDIFPLLNRELDGPVSQDDGVGQEVAEGLVRYLAGERWEYQGELDLTRGTPFQRQVWQEIKAIPYGEVRNYRWIAEQVGCARGQRAVGQANALNPIPLIIPCHRVIRSDGELGGYALGLALKWKLLALEGGNQYVVTKQKGQDFTGG